MDDITDTEDFKAHDRAICERDVTFSERASSHGEMRSEIQEDQIVFGQEQIMQCNLSTTYVCYLCDSTTQRWTSPAELEYTNMRKNTLTFTDAKDWDKYPPIAASSNGDAFTLLASRKERFRTTISEYCYQFCYQFHRSARSSTATNGSPSVFDCAVFSI